jgi:hypothetical protein
MLDIDALKKQLALLDDRLVQWQKADNTVYERYLSAGETLAQIVAAIQADRHMRTESGVTDPRTDLFTLLDDVSDAYLAADVSARGAIRGAFNGKDRVLAALGTYVSRAREMVTTGDARLWLRRGLAAVSILDVRLDPQDIQVSLGSLYVAATRAGVDAAAEFADVASLSSDAYPGKFPTARKQLSAFSESDYFQSAVKPEL